MAVTTRSHSNAAALIIAGGRGTRFWPASRAGRPKPLFKVDGITTLLEQTVARLRPMIVSERIFVMAAADQRIAFKRALRGLLPTSNLLLEPEGRGTAVAIAYGAALIRNRLGEAVLAVLPADHIVTPVTGFKKTLADALGLAHRHNAIVVVGVTPTRAESGYGYQKIGEPVGRGFRVESFVEKPPPKKAAQMVKSRGFLWNAGIFVMETGTLERELDDHAPELSRAIKRLGGLAGEKLSRAYHRLDFDSFDRAVVEKSANVLGVRAGFRWFDVGSWEGLWEALRGRSRNVLSDNVVALESEGVMARSDGRLMVLMGVDDLVAVDTGDVVLIAKRSRSQDIRRIADELRHRGLDHYL